jgi:hypothetical protein
MNDRDATDDLFEPSLRGVARRPRELGSRPWRLRSQFYVAFFGGALAVAAIAWFNSERLGMPASAKRWIPLIGLAGLVASVVAAVMVGTDFSGAQRLIVRVSGVAAFGLLYLLQRTPDRVYHAFGEGDEDAIYDSLWTPGLAATFGLGIVQALVLVAALETT